MQERSVKFPLPSDDPLFKSSRKIRLGIWGLGRGMSFWKTIAMFPFEVVAGCDFNDTMRRAFHARHPKALATDDADAFLRKDFDAVLLATYCVAHADHAIRCMEAGKHVLSEVTAFFTLAEGVRLVEAVERTGRVYQLSENYPFMPVSRYLARKWRAGLFGELQYAEVEYVHELRELGYAYTDGQPLQPGYTVHNWRSWMNYHYYCTHSMGPAMAITGMRPVRVTALPCRVALPGYLQKRGEDMGVAAPSLVLMSNGGVVRNLMGAMTSDSLTARFYGTRGAAEIGIGAPLQFRLGGGGGSPKFEVEPELDALDRMALGAGHGGGDFWVLYHFAREIVTGAPGPFGIYAAADMTLPGILARRSELTGGQPVDIPDFRDPKQRAAFRKDDGRQTSYDTRSGVFPESADKAMTGAFSGLMSLLIPYSKIVRAYLDWSSVESALKNPGDIERPVRDAYAYYDDIVRVYRQARRLAEAYPESDGAKVLRELLELGAEDQVGQPAFRARLRRTMERIWRKAGRAEEPLVAFEVSSVLPRPGTIRSAELPGAGVSFQPLPFSFFMSMLDLRAHHQGKDGMVYVKTRYVSAKPVSATLRFVALWPVKMWVNGREVACEMKSPAPPCALIDSRKAAERPIRLERGVNEIVAALDTQCGLCNGFAACVARPLRFARLRRKVLS